jgi:hypothetical protein
MENTRILREELTVSIENRTVALQLEKFGIPYATPWRKSFEHIGSEKNIDSKCAWARHASQ